MSCGNADLWIQSKHPTQQKSVFVCWAPHADVLFSLRLNLSEVLWHEYILGDKEQNEADFPVLQEEWRSCLSPSLPAPAPRSTKEKSQRRLSLKGSLPQLAGGISSGWATHKGSALVSPFPSYGYVRNTWKNNFAWQNTVYGKLTHFSGW